MSGITEENYGWDTSLSISLLEKLKEDLKRAMLNRENTVRDAIRQVMSEYPKLTMPLVLESGKKTTRIKKPAEITDDDIQGIIRGLVKSERMVLEIKKLASSGYLEILESYLPRPVTREEIEAWISGNLDLSQFKTPMQAMGKIMKHFGRQADGNLVKTVLAGLAGD